MPAKKPTANKKKPANHPPYAAMIRAAILALKDRKGSSRQAIEKYIKANFKDLGDHPGSHLKLALKRGADSGRLVHVKGVGASGSFKLAVAAKPAAKKPAARKRKSAAKKPSAKTTTEGGKTTPRKRKPKPKPGSATKKRPAKPKPKSASEKKKRSTPTKPQKRAARKSPAKRRPSAKKSPAKKSKGGK